MVELESLDLRHPSGVTAIRVGVGAAAACAAELATVVGGGRLFAVSSGTILERHRPSLEQLTREVARVEILEVPDGEAAKTPQVIERLWRDLARGGGKRDSTLLAFGGGTVGDVTGLAAGTFARGMAWCAAPTTLLAQVDASIGGKTAIDLPEAKNAVGVFHHPRLVVSDTSLLATLPARQLRSGLFEVVKVAALFESALLERLESSLDALLDADPEAFAPVVASAAALKVKVVEEDPGDRGTRRLLNFGHTLGHALEAALEYRTLTHGEAVGYGMLFALRLAVRRGLAEPEAERLRRLVHRIGLPPLPDVDPRALAAALERDKKARESGVVWVLPRAVGRGAEVTSLAPQEVERELERFLEELGGAVS